MINAMLILKIKMG